MILVHAVQKLLNTSRLKPAIYISKADENQALHSWYAGLLSSGQSGKMLVMYVHEPSLMTVICKGRTLKGTQTEFRNRLEALLHRYQFPSSFITAEMALTDSITVSRTKSRSMLAFMNNMVTDLEFQVRKTYDDDQLPIDFLEDCMMDYLHKTGAKGRYITPVDYWKEFFSGLRL